MSNVIPMLREVGVVAGMPRPPKQHAGLLALLVTDLEGFTALVQRLGDARGRELIHEHNRIVRDVLAENGGHEVTHTGDGVMASFRSVTSALTSAIEIQRCMHAFSRAHRKTPLRVRVGVHVGEPLPEEERLFGTCVNTAARVCAVARAERVLVTDLARQLIASSDFRFGRSTEHVLKGLAQPVRLHELSWRASAPPKREPSQPRVLQLLRAED